MKSNKILFIVIATISILLVAGFVTYVVLTKDKNTQQTSQITNEKEVMNPKYLDVEVQDVTLFENSEKSIIDYIYSFGPNDWDIEYTYDEELIEIDENYILHTKEFKQDEVIVNLTINPKFDYLKYDEFKSRTFPAKKKFSVFVLPENIGLSYLCTSNDINDFNISIYSDKIKLQSHNLSMVSGVENVLISDITQYAGKVNLHDVEICNALSTSFELKYTISDDNNKKCSENLTIELQQDINYLEYSFVDKMKNNNILFVTKNDEYSAEYPNYASIDVEKNFDLLTSTETLELVSGDEDGIVISSTGFMAKKAGSYALKLVCCGVDIVQFDVNVEDIAITNVNFGETDRDAIVGEELDLTINSNDIEKASDLADYTVMYEIMEGADTSLINSSNQFVAVSSGTYVVKVILRTFMETIRIIVNNPALPEFSFVDSNNQKVENVQIDVDDIINHEYSITYSPNRSYDGHIVITSSSSTIKVAEYLTGGIQLYFDDYILVSEKIILEIKVLRNSDNSELHSTYIMISFC